MLELFTHNCDETIVVIHTLGCVYALIPIICKASLFFVLIIVLNLFLNLWLCAFVGYPRNVKAKADRHGHSVTHLSHVIIFMFSFLTKQWILDFVVGEENDQE